MSAARDFNDVYRDEGADAIVRVLDSARWAGDERSPVLGDEGTELPLRFTPSPFTWRDPATIPRRQFLYGFQLRRGQMSGKVAPGAAGKTTFTIGRAICMAAGREFMGHRVWNGPHRVWLWNLEDEREEIEKTVHAFLKLWNLTHADLGDRLLIDGADHLDAKLLKIAVADDASGCRVNRPVVDAVIVALREYKVDYLDVDPFVSSHSVEENDNHAIDAVAKEWCGIARAANAAIGLTHHVRKPSGGEAQSQSIKRSIDMLREVDLLMLNSSRDMAASLRSIDSQIGGVAALVVRAGNVNADMGIAEGFKPDLIGSVLGKIPLVGGLLSSLFGSKTTVTGSGLFAGPQSLGSILGGGFDASYYSEIEKTKRFLGIKTGTSRSTQYSGADAGLENQFTMILRDFNAAMIAAAGPLGIATSDITQRLNGMVVSIGKIDLKGLTGEQIQEKLTAVFGAAADNMARTAFPGFERFQRVGEGLFETVVRVSSTVETVTASLDRLGVTTSALGIDAQIALADQFESLGALSSATQSFFERFYTAQEQAAAQMAQFDKVFASLGVTMPNTLAGFRALVESQDLTTDAGRKTYAMLLQLAPAFADLQGAMNGARSAADILAERYDLERKLLELQGDTAKLRELDLAKLDESNRALQLQIWALQDAQEAARQADELRKAWGSVGDSIEDEINRIRGLNTPGGDGTFASVMGEFNAMTAAARGGDQDAAKQLPGLSQALLRVAGLTATSRQELDRVQAQTAASLEQTLRLVAAFGGGAPPSTGGSVDALIARVEHSAGTAVIRPDLANDGLAGEVVSLREEIAAMRRDNNAGHAATASNTAGIKRKLDDVTAAGGGEAIAVTGVAA